MICSFIVIFVIWVNIFPGIQFLIAAIDVSYLMGKVIMQVQKLV